MLLNLDENFLYLAENQVYDASTGNVTTTNQSSIMQNLTPSSSLLSRAQSTSNNSTSPFFSISGNSVLNRRVNLQNGVIETGNYGVVGTIQNSLQRNINNAVVTGSNITKKASEFVPDGTPSFNEMIIPKGTLISTKNPSKLLFNNSNGTTSSKVPLFVGLLLVAISVVILVIRKL